MDPILSSSLHLGHLLLQLFGHDRSLLLDFLLQLRAVLQALVVLGLLLQSGGLGPFLLGRSRFVFLLLGLL